MVSHDHVEAGGPVELEKEGEKGEKGAVSAGVWAFRGNTL